MYLFSRLFLILLFILFRQFSCLPAVATPAAELAAAAGRPRSVGKYFHKLLGL